MKDGNIYGHWNCLVMHLAKGRDQYKKPTIEFFDPYGDVMPDEILDNISTKIKLKYNEDGNYLSELLRNQKDFLIEYNDTPLQEHSPKITTCGRHIAVRCAYSHLTLDDYIKKLKSMGNTDKAVLQLTKNV